MNNPRPKVPSKGKCPVCKWPVKVGGIRRTVKGVRRWYHPSCFQKSKQEVEMARAKTRCLKWSKPGKGGKRKCLKRAKN